jgi:RNA polymerase sigma-70 factor (ECF subfamily)
MKVSKDGTSEEDLLQAVGRGDSVSLRALYKNFEGPLFALGFRWYGDRDLAEELVQDVTLRVWRKAATYDPLKGRASAWIFGIARNAATDLARARSRRPVPVEEVPVAETPWEQDSAWYAWEVAKAVRALPEEQQKVVTLAFVHQYTHSEIAESLGVPLGTVKSRIRAALGKIQTDLITRGVVEEPAT